MNGKCSNKKIGWQTGIYKVPGILWIRQIWTERKLKFFNTNLCPSTHSSFYKNISVSMDTSTYRYDCFLVLLQYLKGSKKKNLKIWYNLSRWCNSGEVHFHLIIMVFGNIECTQLNLSHILLQFMSQGACWHNTFELQRKRTVQVYISLPFIPDWYHFCWNGHPNCNLIR